MDFGVIVAAATQEPTLAAWLGAKLLAWLSVAAGLTFVIFVHELGHFLVAKACGVKCEKFYVGFDFFEFRIPGLGWKIPRSLIKFQIGETEYGLGSLPLGGYVKMLGQDDDPRNAEAEAARIRSAPPAERANEAVVAPHPIDPAHPEQAPVAAQTTEGKTILLDPRSYPAKSIPARMAIISAGVIMNFIFAIVLAAVAYRMGVEEVPAIIGSTSPGGAAWVEGIEPGSQIMQIGRRGESQEDVRFRDIRIASVLNSGHELPLLIRKPDGEKQWYEVRPRKTRDKNVPPLVGILGPQVPEISMLSEANAFFNPHSSPELRDHDRVIEAAGQKVITGADLTTIFAQQPLGPITLKIERRERKDDKPVEKPIQPPEILDVTVAARPMRELGLSMKVGPIVAIQKGSVAEKADLQIGDTILEINGQSVGDPVSLSQRLTPKAGESGPISLVVRRKDRQGQPAQRTISLTPQPPLQTPLLMNPVAIESLGIAVEVTNEVAEVAADGPAAAAGIAVGDVVTQAQLVTEDGEQAAALKKALHDNEILDPIKIGAEQRSWPEIVSLLQVIEPTVKLKLTWTHGGKAASADLAPRDSQTVFLDTRGLRFYSDVRTHIAKDIADAARLGYREARDQLLQVFTILHRLITGRVSVTNLSGPGGIINEAAKVAAAGVTPLLLFLTMLSANLAVINFLPIPALDGGHMVFLTAEAIRGKPVDEKLQIRLTVVGVVCLLSLMIFATAMDVQRWLG